MKWILFVLQNVEVQFLDVFYCLELKFYQSISSCSSGLTCNNSDGFLKSDNIMLHHWLLTGSTTSHHLNMIYLHHTAGLQNVSFWIFNSQLERIDAVLQSLSISAADHWCRCSVELSVPARGGTPHNQFLSKTHNHPNIVSISSSVIFRRLIKLSAVWELRVCCVSCHPWNLHSLHPPETPGGRRNEPCSGLLGFRWV